jgi:uncharacterized protein (TIGR02646 family)
MAELEHREIPPELTTFNKKNPTAGIDEFNKNDTFKLVKNIVKATLNVLQGGLCVYCERNLKPDEGQLEHIKPKSKHPDLCFEYTNYAHGCIPKKGEKGKTCGQKKGDELLPIEPSISCNINWTVANNGKIIPRINISTEYKLQVEKTIKILGLNDDNKLVTYRKQMLNVLNELKLSSKEEDLQNYLQTQPFRYILKNYFDYFD